MPKGLNQSNTLSLSAGSVIVSSIALSGALGNAPYRLHFFAINSSCSSNDNFSTSTTTSANFL